MARLVRFELTRAMPTGLAIRRNGQAMRQPAEPAFRAWHIRTPAARLKRGRDSALTHANQRHVHER